LGDGDRGVRPGEGGVALAGWGWPWRGQSLIRFSQMRDVIRLLWSEGALWWVGLWFVGYVQGIE
jgi:hypothetical protein